MASGINLRPHVQAARQRLTEGREKLRKRHESGTPGLQLSAAIADLYDAVVLEIFEAAVADLGPAGKVLLTKIALVPHGGCGRRDVAPYSDLDLMVLHAPEAAKEVGALASRLFRDLNDVGFSVGNAVRTPDEACRMALQDAATCTSQIESRFLVGSSELYAQYSDRLQRLGGRRLRSMLPAILEARGEERTKYGESVYLLEPNVKRSRGTLRGVQLLRWVGFARYGTADPQGLRLCGALSNEDYKVLRDAHEFLLRLRNELHFHAGRAQDRLDRAEQLRIAEKFGFTGDRAVLAVERFMQEYFRHTGAVAKVVTRFLESAAGGRWWREMLAPLWSHQVERDFWVGPGAIRATRRGAGKLRGSLEEVLRLSDLANLYDKEVDHSTSELIRASVKEMPNYVSAEAARRFMSLLERPARLGELLRELHDLAVLEKLIPSLTHARCLLQFNQYHKYTIDEHCIQAVEKCCEFRLQSGPFGRVYRQIKKKWLLHLALLVHDLGKGFEEDHSEVGRRLALETADRLRLSESDAEKLAFLVHQHLTMSHLAFRRDITDDQVVVRFSVSVGSPEMLRMLFVLTAADFAAVGPGVLNDWKTEVLSELYTRCMRHLSGDRRALDTEERLRQSREQVRSSLGGPSTTWHERLIEHLSPAYLHSTPPQQIADELKQLHELQVGQVRATGRYVEDTHTVEYTVATQESVTPGLFHKLAGALAAKGLQVLSAEINTLGDGLVLDRFYVVDGDFTGAPTEDRIESVCRSLETATSTSGPPALHQARRYGRPQNSQELLPNPTQVRFDNSSSDRYTVVDVFAADRTGLLYVIGRALFELGLNVALAKIATHLDQVVDVFYVTEFDGRKVEDDARLQAVRKRLLDDIESFAAGKPLDEQKAAS